MQNPSISDKIDGLNPSTGAFKLSIQYLVMMLAKHELFLGVEPLSGLTMTAKKRSQVNFIIGPVRADSNELFRF